MAHCFPHPFSSSALPHVCGGVWWGCKYVWLKTLCNEGTSSFRVWSFHRLPLFPLPLFSPRFPAIQPKLVQPCAGKHNAMNCFPFLSFFPSLSPSLLPLYSCLIVDCSRDCIPWIAGFKTKAKLCPCWPKMIMMCIIRTGYWKGYGKLLNTEFIAQNLGWDSMKLLKCICSTKEKYIIEMIVFLCFMFLLSQTLEAFG